jgi:hypothetical protein
MLGDRLSGAGLLARVLGALALVYGTYNPEGISFFHWVVLPLVRGEGLASLGAAEVVVGLLLLIGWSVFLKATRRSLGLVGAGLVLALGAALIWLLVEQGVLAPRGVRAISHVALVVVSLVLAIGLSWSSMSRRLTGQLDTDEVG